MRYFPIHLHGILYFVIAMLAFAAMNVTIGTMAGQLPSAQMVFIRNILSFAILLPFALSHGFAAMKTERIGRHISRAVVGLISMQSWFYALTVMPINTATALNFTAPLFTTLLAVLFLGEHIGIYRISALLMGFVGVVIIADPTIDSNFMLMTPLVLFSSLMMAATGIIVKTLTRTEPGWRIVFYMTLWMSVLSAPFAFWVWQPPSQSVMIKLGTIAIYSTIAQLCMAQALKREELVILMPFEFSRLVFTAFLAYLVLGETLTLHTVIGSLIIVSCSAFIAWREKIINKQKVSLQIE
jgi:drug/metabolite transporter (DMT)-like permease